MKTLILYIAFLFVCLPLRSQTFAADRWMEYLEEWAEDNEETDAVDALYTDLSFLADHPFDINSVSGEELRRLPFLTDRQIEEIISYRERYGKLVSLYELKNIQSLDFSAIELLLPFVQVSKRAVNNVPFTVDNLLKYGRNELQVRYDRGFQQKKGYRSQPDSILEQYPNRKYLGEPFYHSLRYSYSFDERLLIGFTGEKDAGEPFWNKEHKGYDYYSGHILLKDIKKLKVLAVGDYKISFGQGLVVSNEFTPGRSSLVTQAERRTYGFRRHFSTNEIDFFRGMAATFAFGPMEVSMFYSYRKMDAAIVNQNFPSIKTDGLHRLVRDREKRRTLPMQAYGGNIRYATPDLCIGLTALTYSFGSYEMQPDPKPYNLFYFRGKRNLNVSIDYLWKRRTIKLYGETAVSRNGALATLNALQLTPVSYISLLLLHRSYSRRYHSFYGNAFAQNSSVQNERGVYMGMQLTPFPYWKVSAYLDVFRFPWLKYGVDAPSRGKEYMVRIDYSPQPDYSFYIRYKYRQKEKNGTLEEGEATVPIISYGQHRLRLQLLYKVAAHVQLRTSADGILYKEELQDSQTGIMLSQSLSWKPESFPLQADVYIAWFHTDNYTTRISSYEKNILYAFNMPSFYGQGLRSTLTFRWNIKERLSLSAKLGHTRYTDRDKIGTDLEEIEGRRKTDLNALLRWKF